MTGSSTCRTTTHPPTPANVQPAGPRSPMPRDGGEGAVQRFINMSVDPRQYWVAVSINASLATLFLTHAWLGGGRPWWLFLLGMLLYSFGEYAFHRWVAHGLMRYNDDAHH